MANNDEGGRSLLGSAVVAAPIVAGGVVTAKRVMDDPAGHIRPVPSSTVTASKIAAGTRLPTAQNIVGPWLDLQAPFIKAEGAEVARQAWQEAVRTANPLTQERLRTFTSRIETMPANEIFGALKANLSNESTAMRRMFERFQSNLGAFTQHATARMNLVPEAERKALYKYLPVMEDVLAQPPPARSPLSGSISADIQRGLDRLRGALGDPNYQKAYTRPQFPGHQYLDVGFQTPSGAQLQLGIPNVVKGSLLEGESMRTRYIAHQTHVFDPISKQVQVLTAPERYLREVEALVPHMGPGGALAEQSELQAALREIRADVFHKLETTTNLPAGAEFGPISRHIDLRSQQAKLVKESIPGKSKGAYHWKSIFAPLSSKEESQAWAGRMGKEYFPGTSASALAGGRLSTFDWSNLHGSPTFIDYSRKPGQMARPYGLTSAAGEAAQKRWAKTGHYSAIFTEQGMKDMFKDEVIPPHLRTVYLSPDLYTSEMERMGLGEGEALARRSARDVLEAELVTHKHLNRVPQEIQAAMMRKPGEEVAALQKLPAGTLLGFEAETGKPVTMQDSIRKQLQAAVEHTSRGKGDHITIALREQRKMGMFEKFFGGMKAVVGFRSDERLRDTLKGSISMNKEVLRGFDVIASMDELKKNANLHRRQMITSLWEAMERRTPGAMGSSGFGLDPFRMANEWDTAAIMSERGQVMLGGEVAENLAQGGASRVTFARQVMSEAASYGKLTPQGFGSVFGTVPYALGLNKGMMADLMGQAGFDMSTGTSQEMLTEVMRGQAAGRSQLFWGGPLELTGAGKLGSLEPRAFHMLATGTLGDTGTALSKEFAERLAMTQPEMIAAHQELGKSLESFIGYAGKPTGPVLDLTNVASYAGKGGAGQYLQEHIVEKGGGWMKMGGSLPNIYVPGAEVMEAMAPYKTAGGQVVRGTVPDMYSRLANIGAQMYLPDPTMTAGEVEKYVNRTAQDIAKQYAPAGKGAGKMLGGKVMGSAFLTAVSPSPEQSAAFQERFGRGMIKGIPAAGIPGIHAEKMFMDMEAMGYNKVELGKMRGRFEAGELIMGMSIRHPIVDPYSLQPMAFYQTSGKQAVMHIPEKTVGMTFRDPTTLEAVTKNIKLSSLVGQAGDKDADAIAAFLVSPENEKRLGNMARNKHNEFTVQYTQHQLRLGLLRSKAPKGSTILSVADKMAADAKKLAVIEQWVPTLSLDMSRGRQAVLMHAQGAAKADALFLGPWLEEMMIKSKALSGEQVLKGQLQRGLQALASTVQGAAIDPERAGRDMEQQIRGLFMQEGSIGQQLFSKDIEILNSKAVERITGIPQGKKLASFDLARATQTFTHSIAEFAASGEERLAEFMAGRAGRLNYKTELNELAGHMIKREGAGASLSKATQTASNIISSAGRKVWKHKAPVGFGFAGALALGAILSSPKDTIGPGSGVNTKARMNFTKARANSRPTDIHPPGHAQGTPSVPPMMHTPRASITSPGPSASTRVRARSASPVDAANLAARMDSTSGGSRSVSMNVRDNRSVMTSHDYAKKLMG